ncbi:D-Ala-D-Ala carboxypeptidase family metallohydrolase [Acinetobacter gerneri]|uniref:D-Ala-D-Ala carboxypeptidase family metallohydrolase n=1 Tax=Acinetobacter gerneri TaxID=202952 RepID=A0AAW8JFB6_9GAMM|nr:D-Ala-D-Ala carboxypeptidase family metallohydrolase [Acinetobacter gerneri]MDQ9009953.1 D-Ala-D-Ala carboxypeptidase family metallohydrolase [Acinetobacter gerneri]MDQ9014127.1 D-Ala-D-Ala carboxypeptidase family metallohydrolase [Acinetobacter gerneri]MDQ9025231.1 D-Ala-D-Ala carboxypeptidase family metallohydrolase [Acinetobacter gerneri]MDQ9050774.1 D-Ala-D-Ala carboxypeptidase family metallohydrolase [Acinetobacter gerneri]MDQ9060235.1 D-Ala-D-Ala carboxypeptidase family metallohydrola
MKIHNKIVCLFAVFLTLTACNKSQDKKTAASDTGQISENERLQYQKWREKNAVQLDEYYQYISSKIKDAPEPYYLVYTGHSMPKKCEEFRYAIPPKEDWSHLVKSLKVIEQLREQGVFKQYRIISTYRSPEMNTCVRGAKKSKHMANFAVDFKIIDQDADLDKNHQKTTQQLCEFWRKKGPKLNMGLGIYPRHIYHIDTAAFRTWGGNYKSDSSPCMQK